MMKKSICFDDVLLEPQISSLRSRKEIKLTSALGSHLFQMPVIASPMDTIITQSMLIEMDKFGGFGVIHRYNTIDEQVTLVTQTLANNEVRFGAAVGVTGDYLERAQSLTDAGCSILCLDVAHGHHTLMQEALTTLRESLGDNIHLMAGNVATLQGFNALADWGADSIRVGVGGGSICSTRVQTGHGVPTLQSVFDCAMSDRDATLIADGGLRNSGDIVKALAAGADFVMCGSILAGTSETPGDIIRGKNGDQPRKLYRGMASREAQKSWRGKTGSVEGVSTTVPFRGPVQNVLRDLEWGIRSGLSYSGAKDLKELRAKAKFIRQSEAAQTESAPHALRGL
jgi:IMP dehydrogenase